MTLIKSNKKKGNFGLINNRIRRKLLMIYKLMDKLKKCKFEKDQ